MQFYSAGVCRENIICVMWQNYLLLLDSAPCVRDTELFPAAFTLLFDKVASHKLIVRPTHKFDCTLTCPVAA